MNPELANLKKNMYRHIGGTCIVHRSHMYRYSMASVSMETTPPALRDRIAANVARQIATRKLAVGQRVPSESELMAEFGASRMTVHHALRDLTAWGLLRRH